MVFGFGNSAVNIIIRAKDEFSKTFNRATLTMKNFSKAGLAAGVVVAGIGAAAVLSLKKVIDFESAFAGVRKTVDLSEKEFEDLENRFKSLSTQIPLTFEELAGIGEIAGQLGVDGVDNLEKFTKAIADISATTNLTAEAAATDFARIANIMQEPLKNVDRMGAAVVELGNNFATTEAEISNFAQRIAGAGKIAGLTTADIFAIGTAFTSVGVEAEAGGTAVQKVLLAMNEATTTGNEHLATFADTAGISTAEFARLFEEDASKAFELFVLGLGNQGDKAIQTLDELNLKDQRLVRSFLSLANAGDLITDTLATSESAWSENTALVEEAEKRYDTMASQIDIAKNKVFLIAAGIGERLVPILKDFLIPFLDKVIGLWESLGPQIQTAIIIGTAAAAMVLALAAAVAILNLVMSPWLLIIFAVAIAIGVLVAIGFLLVKNWDKIKEKLGDVWEGIKDIFKKSVNFLIGLAEGWANSWVKAANIVIDALNSIKVSIPDWIPVIGGKTFGLNIPNIPEINIPRLAKGGIVDRPTLAMIGEDGPEAVIPLSRRGGMDTGVTIIIENLVANDAQSVAEVLQDILDQKIAT